ncbi:MAG: hypothetical protein VKQ33_11815 [Candidatus Sericytochromatia bacterium]|nr:hypothetical protein [Candidatus Sericytochromatia bacterium]
MPPRRLAALLALVTCLGGLPGCEADAPVCTPAASRPLPGTLLGGQARIPTSLAVAGAPPGLDYEVPVNRGEVYLSDTAGRALPGRVALTSAEGAWQLAGVPPGQAFGVVVVTRSPQGKDVVLRTLARTGNQGGSADVNAATTIATLGLCDGLSGPVGEFDRATFDRLVGHVYGKLPSASPLELTDTGSVVDRFRGWYAQDTELRTLVDKLRVEVARPRLSLAEQVTLLLAAQGLPPPPPVVLRSPGPAPTPSPAVPPEEPLEEDATGDETTDAPADPTLGQPDAGDASDGGLDDVTGPLDEPVEDGGDGSGGTDPVSG